MRSRQEHLDMLIGDLELKSTSDGLQYVEFTERETKMRKGQGAARSFAPKMFAQPDNPRCPVKAFKACIRRPPAESLTPESRFYLSISPRYHNKTVVDVENTNICFTLNPLGKNKLGDLVRTMAEKAALDGRKVNHSARKTTVTSLLHSYIEVTTVMQLTGHKNVASLNEYSTASLNQQIQMSHILSDIGSGGSNSGNVCKERSLNENNCLNNNTVNTDSVDEFPNDDNLLSEIDLQNLREVSEVIERYESANTKQQSDNKTVNTTMLPAATFSMFQNASIGNVTINI